MGAAIDLITTSLTSSLKPSDEAEMLLNTLVFSDLNAGSGLVSEDEYVEEEEEKEKDTHVWIFVIQENCRN